MTFIFSKSVSLRTTEVFPPLPAAFNSDISSRYIHLFFCLLTSERHDASSHLYRYWVERKFVCTCAALEMDPSLRRLQRAVDSSTTSSQSPYSQSQNHAPTASQHTDRVSGDDDDGEASLFSSTFVPSSTKVLSS